MPALLIGPGTGRALCTAVRRRADFGELLTARGLTGLAVEVGVHRGAFAADFLPRWPGHYTGVDPWHVIDGYSEALESSDPDSQAARDADYGAALRAIAPYRDRATLFKALSEEAARTLPDGLDFVYIDAAHDYANVSRDIALWWPKIRPGGVLAGHDYGNPGAPDVMQAVDEFAIAGGLVVYLAGLDEQPASWYVCNQEG